MTKLAETNWEDKLRSMKMPTMDVHDRVMTSISRARDEGAPPKRWRIWTVAAVTLIAAVSTGFAAFSAVQLLDRSGETALTIYHHEEDSLLSSAELAVYEQQMEPGETIYVYRAQHNPQGIITAYTKPIKFYDYADFYVRNDSRYPLPASVPDNYRFSEGHFIVHAHMPNAWIDEMIAEGQASGQTITRVKALDDVEIYGLSVKWQADGHEYTMSVTDGARYETIYTNLQRHEQSGMITINGVQGYVTAVEDRQVLYWRSGADDDSYYYQLSTDNRSETGRAQLISLLEAVVLDSTRLD